MNPATELKTNPNPTPESIGVNGEKKTDVNYEGLEQGSTATPFSILFWAALKKDWFTAEAQIADDIEWDIMPNNQIRKGKLAKVREYFNLQSDTEPGVTHRLYS